MYLNFCTEVVGLWRLTCAVRISSAGAVAERDSRASNCRRVCLQGEDFRGEREMEQEREKKKESLHGTPGFFRSDSKPKASTPFYFTRGRKWPSTPRDSASASYSWRGDDRWLRTEARGRTLGGQPCRVRAVGSCGSAAPGALPAGTAGAARPPGRVLV